MTLILPRGSVHYSCFDSWTKSPQRYIDRHFYGKDVYLNKSVDFGLHIMDLLKNDPTNPLVADLPHYGRIEEAIKVEIDGIMFEGTPDTDDRDRTRSIIDYKTCLINSTAPWSKRKVEAQNQLTWYAMLMYHKYGNWNDTENWICEIPTERIEKEMIDDVLWNKAGDKKHFEVTRARDSNGNYLPPIMWKKDKISGEAILKLKNEAVAIAKEINLAFIKHREEVMNLDL